MKAPATALNSTRGRTAARDLETRLAARWLLAESERLVANLQAGDSATADSSRWDPSTWPTEVKDFGFTEATRSALGHWVRIKNSKIANYHAVVLSTWNASPRDARGWRGAYQVAVIGTTLAAPKRPPEVLRTIHSFDPCLACASHVLGPDGETLAGVVVR